MFFYCFDHTHTHNIYQSHHKSKPWDVVSYNGKYYLNLGEEISRPEQWSTTIHFDDASIIPVVCYPQTLTLLHWMVNEWFSSYNKCIPLFLWNDINLLLKHKKAPSKKQKASQSDNWSLSLEAWSQKLYIFPSVFSLTQFSTTIVSPLYHDSIPIALTGSSTSLARAKAYRSLTHNTDQILLATHSQIFQNRYNLTDIIVIDEYSPLYQTYHDPRYNLDTVVQKMREIYDISKK